MTFLFALLLVAAQDTAPAPATPAPATSAPACRLSTAPPSARIAQLLASTDGSSAAKAYRVRSVDEEYQILNALGLCPNIQSLVANGGHPYDVLDATDARTGAARQLWFDISSFFGRW